MCKEITSDEVARTAVIISATTKTPAVAAASEAATRARASRRSLQSARPQSSSNFLEILYPILANCMNYTSGGAAYAALRPGRTKLNLVGK